MKLNNNVAAIELNEKEKERLEFALDILKQNINSTGDKAYDNKVEKSFQLVRAIAYRLGVQYDEQP
jgi:hypothetical protein